MINRRQLDTCSLTVYTKELHTPTQVPLLGLLKTLGYYICLAILVGESVRIEASLVQQRLGEPFQVLDVCFK